MFIPRRPGRVQSCPARSSERLQMRPPPFPLVGKGMGMGVERPGARPIAEAGRAKKRRQSSGFATPTPAPPHKGEGFPAHAPLPIICWNSRDPSLSMRRPE
ncbi:hypothetical protein BOSEA31B_14746 [Hyphomicrobiales bacterium]|nr:hypothetical protein BOSEA31B_14746 [Hyphomicrobiales bacterium]CAH1701236.1 hypothetical protein BOSEA1005_20935 [Hyphomicrobiales bacterium]CAI0345200.1 hypothetical protein BO1005MUT1_370110 [Hyphomicrobiales bacterium]